MVFHVSSMISTRSVLWWCKRWREIPYIIIQEAAKGWAPCCHRSNVAHTMLHTGPQSPKCWPHRHSLTFTL